MDDNSPPLPTPSHPQVRSPLSDSILGEQALAVTDDKVSVLELRVQPVMGISLALSRGTAHPGEVTATCWAQSALPAPKQVTRCEVRGLRSTSPAEG